MTRTKKIVVSFGTEKGLKIDGISISALIADSGAGFSVFVTDESDRKLSVGVSDYDIASGSSVYSFSSPMTVKNIIIEPKDKTEKGNALIKEVNAYIIKNILEKSTGFAFVARAFILVRQGAGKEPSVPEVKEPSALEKTMDAMTTEEKVYQLFFVSASSVEEELPVGGIVLFAADIESDSQVKEKIAGYLENKKIAPFIGVDEEGGIVSRAGANPLVSVTHFPPMAEIGASGDEEAAKNVGKTLGAELSALDFTVDFAPVADVLVNRDNKEIGNRSFGSDAEAVAKMVAAEVKGFKESSMLCALKHFPGHGSTAVNSHNGRAESKVLIGASRVRVLAVQGRDRRGGDFVMVSHMALTADGFENVPSSLSHRVITDLLKGELGFSDIVITDALNMGAVTEEYSPGEAAFAAIDAGADMLLMPEDLSEAKEAIISAVSEGKIAEERIDESVEKILRAKGIN